MKYFGPGLLVSMAYLDPGNLAGDMQAGLHGRYSLLFVLAISTSIGFQYQSLSARLGIVTGSNMSNLIRMGFSSKTSIYIWVMAEIAIIGSDIQEVLGTAIALKILLGVSLQVGVVLTIFSSFFILLFKYYGMDKIEKIFAFMISTMAVCFFVNLVQTKPQVLDIVEGIFVPSYVPGSMTAMLGLIGSIIMPHNFYLHSSLVHERKIDRDYRSSIDEAITYYNIETGISLVIAYIINLCVISTFAQLTQFKDVLNLSNAGQYLSNFGSSGQYIWALGLLAAGQSSSCSGTLAGQYIMEGFIKIKASQFQRSLITRGVTIIPSLILIFYEDPESINNQLNILQAIQLPFAIIPLLKLCRDENLMGQDKLGDSLYYFLIFVASFLIGLNIYGLQPDWDVNNPWAYLTPFLFILYIFSLVKIVVQEIRINKEEFHLYSQYEDEDQIEISNDEQSSSNNCDLKQFIEQLKNLLKQRSS